MRESAWPKKRRSLAGERLALRPIHSSFRKVSDLGFSSVLLPSPLLDRKRGRRVHVPPHLVLPRSSLLVVLQAAISVACPNLIPAVASLPFPQMNILRRESENVGDGRDIKRVYTLPVIRLGESQIIKFPVPCIKNVAQSVNVALCSVHFFHSLRPRIDFSPSIVASTMAARP